MFFQLDKVVPTDGSNNCVHVVATKIVIIGVWSSNAVEPLTVRRYVLSLCTIIHMCVLLIQVDLSDIGPAPPLTKTPSQNLVRDTRTLVFVFRVGEYMQTADVVWWFGLYRS